MVVDYAGKSLSQRLLADRVICTSLSCGRGQILGNGNQEYQQLHNERKGNVKNYYTILVFEVVLTTHTT